MRARDAAFMARRVVVAGRKAEAKVRILAEATEVVMNKFMALVVVWVGTGELEIDSEAADSKWTYSEEYVSTTSTTASKE
jgi:hypothetical protein